jgi:ParB-like chromosome segregation protein Spo0J
MKEKHVQIELDRIEASKTNPRKRFPEEGLKELAVSIREVGLLQPLLVRPKNGRAGATHELIAGERRLRAARLLDKGFKRPGANGAEETVREEIKTLPCVVRELSDDQVLEIQLIENLQREDVSALEEAEGFRRLIDAGKYTAETLAEKLGKSRSHVFGRLRLVNMDPLIKKAMEKGDIDASKAQLLTQVKDKQKLKQLVEWDAPAMSVRDLKEEIQGSYKNLNKAPFDTQDEKLVAGCPSCQACPKRSGNLDPSDKSPNVCTDPECYDKKEAADWKRRVLLERASGFELLKNAYRMFCDGKPTWSFTDGFFLASDKVPGEKEKRTWGKLNGDYLKEAVINRSYMSLFITGKKRVECIRKSQAAKLAEAMGLKLKIDVEERSYDSKAQAEKHKAKEAKRKRLQALANEVIGKILNALAEAKMGRKHLALLVDLHGGYGTKTEGKSELQLKHMLWEDALNHQVDWEGKWNEEFVTAATLAGVDLKALEKEAAAAEAKTVTKVVNAKAQRGKGAKPKTGKKK